MAFGGGLGLAALGIHCHTLPLVYAGYGGMYVEKWLGFCVCLCVFVCSLIAGRVVYSCYVGFIVNAHNINILNMCVTIWIDYPYLIVLSCVLLIVLGGTALGLSYTPPIQTLVSWFTDKKGTATGITIAGFGSGALLFTPAMQSLMQHFSVLPKYLGPTEAFSVQMEGGNSFVEVNGTAVQVVEAFTSDLAKLPFESLQEGLYVVGSGSTGAAEALAVMVGLCILRCCVSLFANCFPM